MQASNDIILPFACATSRAAIGTIREWGEEEFRNSEAEWQNLLARSGADSLFMSWNWQWNWWCHHAMLLKSRLHLLAAYSPQGELVGLAPFHLRRAAHRTPFAAIRLETIGSTWRHRDGAYSEYLDFIVDARFEAEFLNVLADVVLGDHRWSDLVVANTKRCSLAARFVRQHMAQACYVREADPVIAHQTSLPQNWIDYVHALSSGVRRKVWHQRSRLPQAQFTGVRPDQVDSVFSVLNDFHQGRWGLQLFRGHIRAFHLEFARNCAQQGFLRMSTVNIGGSPISVMYNIRIGAMEYNIQSGFSALSPSGTSPGYLHFGFCMEQACNDGVRHFDFLAGGGRHRDYKQDFNTGRTHLVTLQSIRGRPLAWLYRQYDRRAGGGVGGGALPASTIAS